MRSAGRRSSPWPTALETAARSVANRVVALDLLLAVLAGSTGCSDAAGAQVDLVRLSGRTMGTTWEVLLPRPVFDAKPTAGTNIQEPEGALQQRIQDELDAVNAEMSTYMQGSELSRFNASTATDWVTVSPSLVHVVQTAQSVYDKSHGALDVTVAPLVDLWGFGPAKKRAAPPSDAEIEAARAAVDAKQLDARTDPPALRKRTPKLHVDLSSTAKGHGVDRVGAVLDHLGFAAWWVEVGGEVRVRGKKAPNTPWRVAIELPGSTSTRSSERTIDLKELAVASSGDYRNFFVHEGQAYHHIIDPRTGRPPKQSVAQASVFANDCETADAWATALIVLGERDALAIAEAENLAVLLLVRDPAVERGFRSVVSPAYEERVQPGAPK
ncbi:MAG: FAD:protein FMN transferase [Planctomycetes bacterium]|nr:FAD:protein FMN transferase [Planctomycetota bacterium]MCB9917998.1 FAD:protein FMN transferase [Planctomycetota bacterium]